jgi:uncharacterized protein
MRSAALGLLVWLLGLSAWAQTFPPLTGRVVDRANVISAATEAQLTTRLADLETKTGAQVVVATVPSLEDHPIEDYGYRLGRAWKIGQAQKNNGVVFLVAPNERQVTIEVGYGLEPVLTDTLSFLILQQRVLPRFREGKMEEGIVAGVNAVVEQIALDPEQARERVAAAESAQRRRQSDGEPGVGGFLLLMFFVFFILPMLFRGRGRRRRRGLGGAVTNAILWSAVANSGRRGGGWSGGGGFGGGGGGFRGGGGSFGGGGASGGW